MARKQEPKTLPMPYELNHLADAMMQCRMSSKQIADGLATVVAHPDCAKMNEHLQVLVRMAQAQAAQLHALFVYRGDDE